MNPFSFSRVPRYRCEVHGELGIGDYFHVTAPHRARRTVCGACLIETLERLGMRSCTEITENMNNEISPVE